MPQANQAPDVMMESSGKPKDKTSKDSYTVKQFKLHAVLICWLWDLRSEEEYTVVTDYIKPQDVARAAGVLATLTPAQYNKLRTEVLKFESGESQYDILLTPSHGFPHGLWRSGKDRIADYQATYPRN